MLERAFSSRTRRKAGALVVGMASLALLVVASAQAGSATLPAGNLVQNPGAEDGPADIYPTVVPPAGWTSTGAMTAWVYPASEGDRPVQAFAATIGGGKNFFSGGPGGVAGQPTASQRLDVSAAATEIDAGTVAATLSAFIGGYTVSEDLAQVDAVFYDAAATRLGNLRIGPVNRDDRNRLTTLLKRSAVGTLPVGTRRIDVVISVKVDNNGANNAYVDNISLTLAAVPATSGKATLTLKCAGKTLVIAVRPAAGSVVSSVTFVVNARPVAIDKKAPFTARIATAGLPAQLKVTARVLASGKTSAVSKPIRRC